MRGLVLDASIGKASQIRVLNGGMVQLGCDTARGRSRAAARGLPILQRTSAG